MVCGFQHSKKSPTYPYVCPSMTTMDWRKRRCWNSDLQSWLHESVQEEDCGLWERWWKPDFYLKNTLEQVTTSHWANREKSWPHAITLGQITHTLCSRWPKKMSHRPQGFIWVNYPEPSHFSLALALHFLLCSLAYLASDLLGNISCLWPCIHPLGLPMLSFWPSQCCLRTGLPSSPGSCWSSQS